MRLGLSALLLSGLLLTGAALAQTDTSSHTIPQECSGLQTVIPTPGAEGGTPVIRVIEPSPDGVVYGSAVTITVETENFPLDEGRHWHVWVNRMLQGMVYQPTAMLELEPGTYSLCVSMGDEEHAEIGIPVGLTIQVEAAQAGIPTATPALPPGQTGIVPQPEITPGEIALVVVVGLLAAGAGWWLGARLPKNRGGHS